MAKNSDFCDFAHTKVTLTPQKVTKMAKFSKIQKMSKTRCPKLPVNRSTARIEHIYPVNQHRTKVSQIEGYFCPLVRYSPFFGPKNSDLGG